MNFFSERELFSFLLKNTFFCKRKKSFLFYANHQKNVCSHAGTFKYALGYYCNGDSWETATSQCLNWNFCIRCFLSTLVLSNPLLLDKIVGRGEEFYLRQFQQSVDRMFNSHLTSTSLADCQRRKSKLPGETEFKICCSCHTLKWTVLPPKYYYLYVPHKSLASSVPYSLAPRNCSCKNNDRKQVQI